ncbi:hypothetical protein Ae201684P_019009 [Aphanomyces euteiches]|nr:hypothetical protein Ae201684P_019009 [Aphanomyces euteiches]
MILTNRIAPFRPFEPLHPNISSLAKMPVLHTAFVAAFLATSVLCGTVPSFSSPLWQETDRDLSEANITFWLGVRAENPRALLETFESVTDPTNHRYMQYLSKEEANALTKPSKQAYDTLTSWLKAFDFTYSEATNVFVVNAPVAAFEMLTHAKVGEFAVIAPFAPRPSTAPVATKLHGSTDLHAKDNKKAHNERQAKPTIPVTTAAPTSPSKAKDKAPHNKEPPINNDKANKGGKKPRLPPENHTPPAKKTPPQHKSWESHDGRGAKSRSFHRILKAKTTLHIPDDVLEHIEFISANLPPAGSIRAERYLTSESANAGTSGSAHHAVEARSADAMTPAKLRKMYGVPKPEELHVQKATQAIAAFYENSFSYKDLRTFYSEMNETFLPQVNVRGNRKNNESGNGSEAALDLQYISVIAPNAATSVWVMNGSNPFSTIDEPFLEWAADVLDDANPPLVHSLSYSDDERHVHQVASDYIATFDTLLQKMALRGLTILVASGDDGVMGLAYRHDNLTLKEACVVHRPEWPSSSPYVTSVGATMKDPNSGEEVVCSSGQGGRITSGGGFSNIYARPSYQQRVVERYVKELQVPDGFYNKHGRGYPDISAFGSHYRVRSCGAWKLVSGTSAACPVIAAMVTLWNDRRLLAGKKPLGFLNPLLYYLSDSKGFRDIVKGNNAFGKIKPDKTLVSCEHSFHATAGWDAVTGLGVPRFKELSTLFFYAELLAGLKESNVESLLGNEKHTKGYNLPANLQATALLLAVVIFTIGFYIGQRRRKQYLKLDPMRERPHTP